VTAPGAATTVSERGRPRRVPSVSAAGVTVLLRGRLLTIGEVHDEAWLSRKQTPEPGEIVSGLRRSRRVPDLFTFAQKFPDVAPRHAYRLEWDNLAVASFASSAEWFERQVDRSVRKHVRKAAREGVVADVVPYTDELVAAISAIYNEMPVRQGRPFWHFGKPFDTVKAENGTYLERSTFIAARHGGEVIGFLKLVLDDEVASIMQILAKAAHFERRPTNALLAKAVEVCAARGIGHLVYGRYTYGSKRTSTLIDFKRNNGFREVRVPRYYVPLTLKGRLALWLGGHRGVRAWLPEPVRSAATDVRARWHARRAPARA
jgi:hypothetical protein